MPKIEYLAVADHAEAINGKLYLHGAGWTDVTQPIGPGGQPGIVHLGLAASILVGWTETNRRFPFDLVVVHEDGDELAKISAQVEAGRPAGIPEGSDLRNVIAVNAEIQFPKAGTYELRATLESQVRSVTFRVRRPVNPGGPAALPFAQQDR
jgi:hypothetical protein